ncbi:MAG: hypothetical protein AAGK78_13355, partial [Planctomycetota bacterium]
MPRSRRHLFEVVAGLLLALPTMLWLHRVELSSRGLVVMMLLIACIAMRPATAIAFAIAVVFVGVNYDASLAVMFAWALLCVAPSPLDRRVVVLRVGVGVLLAGWLLWPIWLAPNLTLFGEMTRVPAWSTMLHPWLAWDAVAWPG